MPRMSKRGVLIGSGAGYRKRGENQRALSEAAVSDNYGRGLGLVNRIWGGAFLRAHHAESLVPGSCSEYLKMELKSTSVKKRQESCRAPTRAVVKSFEESRKT